MPRPLVRACRSLLVAALAAPWAACIPYTVGSTAQTVPQGEVRQATTMYWIPNAARLGEDRAATLPGLDGEARWGLSGSTDVGLRVTSLSGMVVSLKHRLRGGAHPDSAAVSIMPGLGIVNGGEHAHVELSLVASGRTRGRVTPYGGLRVMQVAPITEGAVHDSPTAGGFLGLRLGSDELGVAPEVGVFYDRSALGMRDRRVIVVPSITVRGDAFRRLLRPW